MESKGNMIFSFCGNNDVNALAVSDAIKSLVEMSTAVAEKEYPDVEFRLTVRAVEPGSLEFVFAAVAIAAQSILTPQNVEYAANMISVMSAAFSIKKFLKGRSPKRKLEVDDKIVITRADGETLVIPKGAGVYFVDARIDRSVSNIINSAKSSDGVTGIAIDADQRVEILRQEFDGCAPEIPVDSVDEETMVAVRYSEPLYIRQADFSGGLKWRFTGAENITASISDEDFLNRVKSGRQEIRAKTYIIADVKVTICIGPDGLPDETRRTYEITKVHSVHLPADDQITI